MKKVLVLLVLVFGSITSFAQLDAPDQTDTLYIQRVTYNLNYVEKAKWPFDIIIRTPTYYQFGNKKVKIVSAERDVNSVDFKMEDKSILHQDSNGVETMIKYSNYEFICKTAEELKKSKEKEYDDDGREKRYLSMDQIEQKPSFNGGDTSEFAKWVYMNLQYPSKAKAKNIQGRVIVKFSVLANGSVSNITILRGVEPSLDREAVRVISSSPKWKPAMSHGVPVVCHFTFPVVFSLE